MPITWILSLRGVAELMGRGSVVLEMSLLTINNVNDTYTRAVLIQEILWKEAKLPLIQCAIMLPLNLWWEHTIDLLLQIITQCPPWLDWKLVIIGKVALCICSHWFFWFFDIIFHPEPKKHLRRIHIINFCNPQTSVQFDRPFQTSLGT